MTLYTAMVDHAEDGRGVVQVFWAEADTIGEALARIADALPLAGFPEPWHISELDPYRTPLPAIAEAVCADVWCADTRHEFPEETVFRLPVGIIKSCVDGEYEANQIRPGYVCRETGSSIVIEAVVAKDDLLERYLALVALFGRLRVSWFMFQPDWEQGGAATYVNEAINDARLLGDLLAEHRLDLFENGHLTVTAFVQEGSTNINLTDHKTIAVWTTSRDIANRVVGALQAANLPALDPLISIEAGFHHWHYRPRGSRSRAELTKLLSDRGFTRWEPKPLKGDGAK